MADKFQLVEQYLASLRPSNGTAATPRKELLAEDATMHSLNFNLSGRDAVLERMGGADTGKVFRDVTWSKPEPFGDQGEKVRIIGTMPNGSGTALVFHFKGDQISKVQHQAIVGGSRPATELVLPPEVKELVNNALSNNTPLVIGYTDLNGQQVLTFRGSTQVFSDNQLAIWVRHAEGGFIQSIKNNPRIALMYRDNAKRATYMFQGRAWVSNRENDRKHIYNSAPVPEQNHDFALLGAALIIDLDSVEGFAGLGPNGPINAIKMARGAGKAQPAAAAAAN